MYSPLIHFHPTICWLSRLYLMYNDKKLFGIWTESEQQQTRIRSFMSRFTSINPPVQVKVSRVKGTNSAYRWWWQWWWWWCVNSRLCERKQESLHTKGVLFSSCLFLKTFTVITIHGIKAIAMKRLTYGFSNSQPDENRYFQS